MPYVGPATGQVIPRRSRRDKPAPAATSSAAASASTSTPTPNASTAPSSSSSPSSTSQPTHPNPSSSAIGVDNPDMLTPRPTSHQTNVDNLTGDLAATSIDDQPGPSRSRTDRSSKRHGSDGSKTASEADLSASESSASLTSLSTQSEIGTPPTTSTTPDMLADVEARALGEAGTEGVEGRVMRYREGLYAYTRNLYLEAKLSQTKKAGGGTISQFGLKQSGMERLAAKKALARRLNA